MKIKYYLFFFLVFTILSNCKQRKESIAGVVLTFDDKFFDEWVKADSVLSVYNWKATFFVTKVNQLTDRQIILMRKLNKEGHEIGGHGFYHIHAAEYIDSLGIDKYLGYEIIPMLKVFDSLGFTLTSFAYPYGSCNSVSDSALITFFSVVRQIDWAADTITSQKCFYENGNLVKAYPLDNNYKDTDWEDIASLLNYAKENNKIVIFYSHCPMQHITGNYQVGYDKLEKICSFVVENDMKFYTITELLNIQK